MSLQNLIREPSLRKAVKPMLTLNGSAHAAGQVMVYGSVESLPGKHMCYQDYAYNYNNIIIYFLFTIVCQLLCLLPTDKWIVDCKSVVPKVTCKCSIFHIFNYHIKFIFLAFCSKQAV